MSTLSLIFTLIPLFIMIIIIDATTIRNETQRGVHLQIFDNIAEISRPIVPEDLPATFSQAEWYDVRSDSFRLVGYCVTIRAQMISFTSASLNGQKLLIKRDPNNETYTDGVMADESRNLVQDLTDNTFYTITNDRIRYLSIPPMRNYSVNFVYETLTSDETLYLRYLQNNIKWQARYDLLLDGNDTNTILQAYADIRNDGSSSLLIDRADLVSGDVNIQSSSNSNGGGAAYGAAPVYYPQQSVTTEAADYDSVPTINPTAQELAGLYVFSINETFRLEPRSNYILPMIAPQIQSERYGLIDKYFTRSDFRGNAQRAYRIRVPDSFLPKGQVFVRESDRLVGETIWTDRAANETHEFTLGQDPDLQYTEFVQLNSRRHAYEANGYRFVLSTYTISLTLLNNKDRSMNIEYRLKFSSQDHLTLKENTSDNAIQLEGSTIVGFFALDANAEQQVIFTIETK